MGSRQAALLLLADGRLPAGGYAHSGGLEPAAMAGRVTDVAGLEAFLIGRVETTGRVAASFAASTCSRARRGDLTALAELDTEFDARTPSAELRQVSRNLGRQLRRAMSSIHPHPHFDVVGPSPHQPIVMGVAAAVLDLAPSDAAMAILHETITGAAAAAAKVMSIDPFDVHAILARATQRLDRLASQAADAADVPIADLPAAGSPLADIGAEHHRSSDVRLFAS